MDRALWLLLQLRTQSLARRWGRNLRTLKGLLLALVGSLVFLPVLIGSFFAPKLPGMDEIASIRRFGPLALFAYCVLNLLLATGERAIYFSPAEVDFLFSGPFRRRQILLYKITGSFGSAVLSAVFMTFVLGHHAANRVSAFVGLLLAVELLSLFTMAMALASSTVAALAFDRRRKLVLLGLGAIALTMLLQVGADVARLRPWELVDRLESSPIVQGVVLPFRPFILAFTAERLWPDLLLWAGVSAAVDLGLLAVVLAMNARYYEVAATASARIYERLRRVRSGVAWSAPPTRARFTLPILPWCGGVGPNLWRQLISAARDPGRLVALMIILQVPVVSLVFARVMGGEDPSAPMAITMFVSIALFAPAMVGYDFRLDLDRMEELKVLPMAPEGLVLGQVLSPTLLLTLGQWISLAVLAKVFRPDPMLVGGVAALIVPANLLLVELENLFFLWYPSRFISGPTVEFQAMGRQMLLMLGKFVAIATVAAISSGVAAGAYFLCHQRWPAALAAGWVSASAASAGFVPLLALAFRQFDVARERPS